MKKQNSILAMLMAILLCIGCLTACGQAPVSQSNTDFLAGGVLCLKVNPEIAVHYDAEGFVTAVIARNDDGDKILENYSGFEGKRCKKVVAELVNAIGDAGYFVEEVEGESRKITIEIEGGSKLPNENFLDEVVSEVQVCMNDNSWNNTIDVQGESNYTYSNYDTTDYSTSNYDDAASNYDDAASNYDNAASNYADAASNYDNAASNYDDATSNYDDAASNYSNYVEIPVTPSAPSEPVTPVTPPAPTAPAAPVTPPAPAASDYDDAASNYGGDSGYDAGSNYGSDYGDSGYDD